MKLFIIMVLISALAFTACGGDDGDSSGDTDDTSTQTEVATEAQTEAATETQTEAATEPAAETEQATEAIEASSGDTVALGTPAGVGPFNVTVASVTDPIEPQPGLEPAEGNRFIGVEVVIENTSDEAQTVSTILNMSLRDATGQGYDIDFTAQTAANSGGQSTPEGNVPAGGTLRGNVGFQIPAGTALSDLAFEFTAGLLTPETVTFALQ